jgi:hypothetical protein
LVVYSNANAIPIGEIAVLISMSKEAESSCELSKNSINAQVETIIRSNSIKIASTFPLKRDYPSLFLEVSAAQDKNHINSCYGHVNLTLGDFLYESKPPYSTRKIPGYFVICSRHFSFTGPKGFDQQDKLNSAIADITRQCISEILKR